MFSAWREIWQSKSVRAKKKKKNQKPKAIQAQNRGTRKAEGGRIIEEDARARNNRRKATNTDRTRSSMDDV